MIFLGKHRRRVAEPRRGRQPAQGLEIIAKLATVLEPGELLEGASRQTERAAEGKGSCRSCAFWTAVVTSR